MASESEKTKIVTTFLKDSPPGEFNNVLKDCREVVGDDSIFQECLPICLHDYNTEQLTVVMDGTNPVIISKYTEQSAQEFIDPVNKKVVTFDHLSKQITSSQPLSSGLPGNDSLRQALQKKLDNYAKEFYPKGAAIVMPKDNNTYTIIISAADLKVAQFSNGKWRSEWTISVGSKVTCEGRIRVQVHYFEDANIQMHTDTKKKVTCNGGSEDQIAQNVIKEIKNIEDTFHAELDKIFATLSDNCLKALRRQLPISRQKINWANWKGHKMMK
ncbi:f-actin capping protein alpha subunit putative [Entamoeba histolytica]|uniref:F-actin-capping protein subunit alpha n=5 Tax=Entamoeba TaxID=5758 RepID=C4M3N6_ENTH1|nr:F-actin capping protein alpha subunit, putative [Entamoeba histolytica HM-1:IMSS]XP_654210.1 F-actin capping protein subunit alpha, putative [Entamoeba histolytica HM-1:IMSS]BAN38440.1 F-actin capping protein subunit alpha, putative [Entamoeba histolytica]EAL45259.1 F-actin capping protein alpha subunit, putative [Entamoeba histolytica HM-1:IMSS]EAL48821.1 F-actin capping protein subunit alpha, putative [Entamoeba histolytica HM-1:IMSS]BAN39784.1 F-actin capping protein subunit alpha, putat|eukprot:XP_650645.1 F-actin capping protein alpha subunit, putative [Entamoeba histolytica HM-1:IMSS]